METQLHLLFPPSVPLIPLLDMYIAHDKDKEKPFILNAQATAATPARDTMQTRAASRSTLTSSNLALVCCEPHPRHLALGMQTANFPITLQR